MKLLSLLCGATVLMIVLKLMGVTPDLLWWSVTCPLWGITLGILGYYAGGLAISLIDDENTL